MCANVISGVHLGKARLGFIMQGVVLLADTIYLSPFPGDVRFQSNTHPIPRLEFYRRPAWCLRLKNNTPNLLFINPKSLRSDSTTRYQ